MQLKCSVFVPYYFTEKYCYLKMLFDTSVSKLSICIKGI